VKTGLLILFIILFQLSCEKTDSSLDDLDFRQEMRDFVIDLSDWSKLQNSSFIIIPQNGQELIQDTDASVFHMDYLDAIDATGRESMFYGYYTDDQATPEEDKQHLLDLCISSEAKGVEVLATDYCFSTDKMSDSYLMNEQYGFISFAADERDLNNIPEYPVPIHNENMNSILTIEDTKNFLYIINSENYAEKAGFIDAVSSSNYDLIIMDLFHNEEIYNSEEIAQLKTKANGASRIVICYMSIGEAEDYRYYWKSKWSGDEPDWLEAENSDWPGNYKVRYWMADWQNIIFGTEDSYLQLILDLGFNGVYLDIIDGFEYFEELQ